MNRRKPQKSLRHNGFSAPIDAPFTSLGEPPTADYRGLPSTVCPCGSPWLVICATFDNETRLPGGYLLDARCSWCGAWVTPVTPIDDNGWENA